ncbi:MAG TPA: M20 family peptidase [Pyrinomonadaceae bacterium]|nr:M20 family peptidase [Pyrinomonadaceae bacterium]
MKKRIFLVLALAVVVLASVLVVNTFRFTSKQIQVETVEPLGVDEGAAAGRLAGALRFQTVSFEEQGRVRGEEFAGLHRYLEENFPKAHAAMERESVGGYSLLYTWRGRDEGLKPVLLAAHQDVVPVGPETLAGWEQPPFEGRVAGGYVWGRGALDDKSSLLAVMEAAEALVGEGFRPRRTIYLAFGADEEVGGAGGAAKVAELLLARGVALEYVLDEGLAVTEGIIPDVSRPVATVGVAEKGFVSLELIVDGVGGHSSMPPPQTAVGILGAAVARLEGRQMPASLDGVTRQLLEHVGPEMPFSKRLVMANLWLFGPLVERKLAESPGTNAGVRTTTAATLIGGGVKENVLPSSARAVVNFRILPGDSIDGVVAHAREAVADPRVKISRLGAFAAEPSPVSGTDTVGFQTVRRTVRQVFPDTLVAPALVLGATDARHYARLTTDIYRFSPMRLRRDDLERLHGTNERISVKDYAACVRFYHRLIRNSAQ